MLKPYFVYFICLLEKGHLYSLLRLCVFGSLTHDELELLEEGKLKEKSTTPPAVENHSFFCYYTKLLICLLGLQLSYLTWGLLQVCYNERSLISVLQLQCVHELDVYIYTWLHKL